MIISASRRTDIPSFYSEWFFQRLKEQYVLVRNPVNPHLISRISLSPDVVDGIVFWTKNPLPMLDRLSELEKYPFYFQFTLTAYGKDIEPNLPSKNTVIIPAFQQLSRRIGKHRVIWRYDPIFFNEVYTMEYHCRYFRVLASKLGAFTEKCTVSFLDPYKSIAKSIQSLKIQAETEKQQYELLQRFSRIAQNAGITIDTCAEPADFSNLGIPHACCIDRQRLERIGQWKLSLGKDPNQRKECGCISSIDIGAYNTCKSGCLYCYANSAPGLVIKNTQNHNPLLPLLFGQIGTNDIVKDRKMKSCREGQMSLFLLPETQ